MSFVSCWRAGRLSRQHGAAPRCASSDDRGMVVAETALAIPVLVALAAALIWGVSVAGQALVLADAAHEAARDVARGVASAEAAHRISERIPAARVSVEESDGLVLVVLEQDVPSPLPLLRGVTVPLRQEVTALREWS